MLNSFLLLLATTSFVLSSNNLSHNKVLFCLKPNIYPLTIKTSDNLLSTGISELDAVISKYSITKIEHWIPGSNEIDHDGDIYLNRIYRAYLFNNDSIQISDLKTEFENLSCILSAEVENIHRLVYLPNDTYFPQQWSLEMVKAIQSWDYWDIASGELPQNPSVLLASVDTGVDWNHPDLINSIWQNPGEDLDGDGTIVFSGNEWIFDPDDLNNIDDDGNGFIDDFIGWDCSGYDGTDDNNPELPIQELTDNNFNWTHGTMVAGLLSAETDNSGGIASVSFGNDLISIKCSREEVGDNAVINDGFAGVTYAAKVGFYAGSFTIINCSWGSNIYSSYEQAVINIAHNQYGAVIVGASGNGDGFGNPLPEPFYPASYENVVSVTAVDENYSWCGWGNYHSSIDIAAPGVNIVSSILGENYSSASGTSFASPIVASCFGLLKSYYPDSSNLWLEQQILETADTTFLDNIDPEFDGLVGAGIIDIEAAIGHNLDNNYKLQITNYKLMECFPNPFNPKTTISYQLPTPSSVQLTVYNVNGQLVEQLVSSSSWQEAGNHRVGWDATNYPSGVYFVKLVAGGTSAGSIQGYTQTQKVMLLK